MRPPDLGYTYISPKLHILCRTLICFVLFAAGLLQASTIVVSAPSVSTTITSFPFAAATSGMHCDHYQQIYSNLILNAPLTIHAIEFYSQPELGGQLLDNSTWTIKIAATTQWINNLGDMTHSIVNDAAHVQHVTPQMFYTGQLTIGAGGVVRIAGSPFVFNPSLGNLIIDIVRTPNGTPTTSGAKFLAQVGGYDPARQFNNAGQWGSATNPDWNYAYSRAGNYWDSNNQSLNENYGLVTGFEYAPEPGTFVLMGGALGIALLVARRRARRQPLADARGSER
jgi:hypothetical protein